MASGSEDAEKLEHCQWDYQIVQLLWEIVISFLGIYLRENEIYVCTTARVILWKLKSQCVTTLLKTLLWLPISLALRIKAKVLQYSEL